MAIVRIGESRVGRLRGMSALRLTLEAARAAIQDAGVTALAIEAAVRQLRGVAGRCQVPGAAVALVSGFGGVFAASATAILGTVAL